jgi:hypothetical protein
MNPAVTLTIARQRKKLPPESRTHHLFQGIIEIVRSAALQRTIYFCLPLNIHVKARDAKQTNPKKWKFDETL